MDENEKKPSKWLNKGKYQESIDGNEMLYEFFFHVEGEKRIKIVNISNLPTNIINIKVIFDISVIEA